MSDKSSRSTLSFEKGSSLTHQSFKDECDINNIIPKYRKTGVLGHVKSEVDALHYGDFSNVADLHESYNRVHTAEKMFSSLPLSIRSRFGNSVTKFLDFAVDPENLKDMERMGLSAPTKQGDTKRNEPKETPVKAGDDNAAV